MGEPTLKYCVACGRDEDVSARTQGGPAPASALPWKYQASQGSSSKDSESFHILAPSLDGGPGDYHGVAEVRSGNCSRSNEGDTCAIIHRVNNWDALSARCDELRRALEALVDTFRRYEVSDSAATSGGKQAFRAAVRALGEPWR